MKKPESEFPSEELTAPESSAAELDLHEYVALVWRHRWILALSLAIGLGAALGHWALAPRLYRATAILNVERERSLVGDIKSSDEGSREVDSEFLQTQRRLLQSREVAERVVRNLQLAVPASTSQPGKPADTKDQPDPTTRAALAIQRSVEVNAVRDTTLVELSYVSRSPVQAARLANAVAAAYMDWKLEARVRYLNDRTEFFLSQIAQAKKELDEKEQKLLSYGREKDIVAADVEKSTSFQNMDALNRDYAAAVADRVTKEARYQELRTAPPDTIANTLSSGFVAQLQSEQGKLEREYSEKLNVYKPEWPAMQQLKAQIERGRQHLDTVVRETVDKARESARSEYLTALRREANLKAALQSQRVEAQAASSDAVEYNNLRVEVQTQRALLDTLLRREAETEVLSRLQGERASNIRIVDRALVPSAPFAPSLPKDVVLGLILGGLVGVGLIFIRSQLDRSLRSSAQVREMLGLPTLASIPGLIGGKGSSYGAARLYPRRKPGEEEILHPELVTLERPRTRMAEAYRTLRTSLLLSRAGGIKSMVVTSGVQLEGKTSVAANLAIVLAQLDKTVVLVDADLHHPRLHEVFGVSNRSGLASVVAGQINFLEALTATPVPGVTLLPAGPSPPDPSVLLASVSMSGLLTALGSSFDFVVIDSPPVGAVTDAVLLAAQADGAILCVRAGSTPRELATIARDKLQWSGVRVLGVALTMAEDDASRAGYYAAYYGEPARDASKAHSAATRQG